MAGDKLQLISNALIDVFGVLGIPTATAQGLIHRYIKNRANDALRILLEELRRGNIDVSKVADQNEVVDVIYQYGIAVRDNVALRNLRLLSQVFRGLICQGSLYADDFSKYASCLSTLNRDEIVVLGNLHACRLSATEKLGRIPAASEYWPDFVQMLVPSHFNSEDFLRAVVCGTTRSGLVMSEIMFSSIGLYSTSPLMDKVYELVDFEAALREEGGSSS